MKKIAIVLAVLGILGAASVASADTLDDIQSTKVIRVGMQLGLPPYSMLDANTQPIGSDYETAKQLADDWGVKLEIVPLVGASRIPFLLSGKVDVVISALGMTEERKKVIDFSKPYGALDPSVWGPPSEVVNDLKGLEGKSVAVPRGSVPDNILSKAASDYPGIIIKRYDDDATVVAALSSGQETYTATTTAQMNTFKDSSPNLKKMEKKFVLVLTHIGIGVRKNEPRLKEALDAWLDKVIANGHLNEISEKYFGQPLDPSIVNQ